MATFVVDTAIALLTAGAPLEPMVWLSRLAIPLYVLRATRAERTKQRADVSRAETVEVAA